MTNNTIDFYSLLTQLIYHNPDKTSTIIAPAHINKINTCCKIRMFFIVCQSCRRRFGITPLPDGKDKENDDGDGDGDEAGKAVVANIFVSCVCN